MTWRVGTSGWSYRDWRGSFYEQRLPQRSWLAAYAEVFDCVELNNSFYRLPEQEQFRRWAGEVPAGFSFAVKASRFLTHIKRLQGPGEPVDRLLDRTSGLEGRLGPVLLQLPPTLVRDVAHLDETLGAFAGRTPLAVEPRHDSWWHDDVRRVLEDHRAALVWSDRGGRLQNPAWVTAGWGYVRLHHGRTGWEYGTTAVRNRARRWGAAFDSGWVFCNNDPGAAAVRDARRLADELR